MVRIRRPLCYEPWHNGHLISRLLGSCYYYSPVNDSVGFEVIECGRNFTQVKSDGILAKRHVLLQMIAQVTAQQQIYHHEQILNICSHQFRGKTDICK